MIGRVLTVVLLLVGCSSEEPAPPAPADAGEDVVVRDPCDSFTTSGAPCDPVSSRVCFPLCTNGGCQCVQNADGTGGPGGVWRCVTDTSCFPDAAPYPNDGF